MLARILGNGDVCMFACLNVLQLPGQNHRGFLAANLARSDRIQVLKQSTRRKELITAIIYGCFLKWWYPQNTPKWSFLVGFPPIVVGYHRFRKPPYNQKQQMNKGIKLRNKHIALIPELLSYHSSLWGMYGKGEECQSRIIFRNEKRLKQLVIPGNQNKNYHWWLKSCTTWDVWNLANNGINYQPQLVIARFLPSTVPPL